MKVKHHELVKINGSGRVSLTISRTVKPVLFDLIERSVNRKTQLFDLKMKQALLSEIYLKYYTVLHLDRVNRILLSRAQAYALWDAFGYDYKEGNPELANIMMQLHQKLS